MFPTTRFGSYCLTLALCVATNANAAGAWLWEAAKIDVVAKHGLNPDFVLTRAGTFNSQGLITPIAKESWCLDRRRFAARIERECSLFVAQLDFSKNLAKTAQTRL